MTACLLACGIDPNKSILFQQSQVTPSTLTFCIYIYIWACAKTCQVKVWHIRIFYFYLFINCWFCMLENIVQQLYFNLQKITVLVIKWFLSHIEHIRMQHRTQNICALEILEIEPEIVQLSRETWQLLVDFSLWFHCTHWMESHRKGSSRRIFLSRLKQGHEVLHPNNIYWDAT